MQHKSARIISNTSSIPIKGRVSMKWFLVFLGFFSLIFIACGLSSLPSTHTPVNRIDLLPDTKYSPEMDYWPPIASNGWSKPEPLPYPVNTSGGEDSPFILPDGQTLYFFFTPDVSIPAEKQLMDGVTGIWITRQLAGSWSEPERIWLEDPGEIALDGCEFISGNIMYFCTAREGYSGIHWFKAEFQNGAWGQWQFASDELKLTEYQVGELHISADGQNLFYHSDREGGLGDLDIWNSSMAPDGWGEPVNLGAGVNTPGIEGWPYLSPDGMELWYLGTSQLGHPGPAIFMSRRQPDGNWGVGVEIISSFAGEPALSADGQTLYFVHHYFSQDLQTMLEADIYVSHKIP
jgi:hypothetical protein